MTTTINPSATNTNPFKTVVYESDDVIMITFLRDPETAEEMADYQESMAGYFSFLFGGNPRGFYTWMPGREPNEYEAVRRAATVEDFKAHLWGSPTVPMLSIPIRPDGTCRWGAIDVDRKLETDPPVDHAALARQITEQNLPLIVCRSKSGKGAWLFCFFQDEKGAPASRVRKILSHYAQKLGLGKVEIFPKQEILGDDPEKSSYLGNGINLPYCYGLRHPIPIREAFDAEGNPLWDFIDFMMMVEPRRFYSYTLERDLGIEDSSTAPRDKKHRPMTVEQIRATHRKNLEEIKARKVLHEKVPCHANSCECNAEVNKLAYFAARASAAHALEGTEAAIKQELLSACQEAKIDHGLKSTLDSGWNSGIKEPLIILDPIQAHDEALVEVDGWLGDANLPIPPLEEAVCSLGFLNPLEYEDRRKRICKRLAVRPSVLDREVEKKRPRPEKIKDEAVEFKPSDPWPAAVDGSDLLDRIARFFLRFIIFQRKEDADILALWAAGTHCYDMFNIFARICITSPEKECGKTTIIDILDHLTLRAQRTDNLTVSVMFHIMELYHPSLLIDELDSFIKDKPELINVLNSGHKKGGFVFRMEKENDQQKLTRFSTYGPVAYGLIGQPTGTLLSRSISIGLVRKKESESTEDFDVDENPSLIEELTVLRRQLARWVADHHEDVAKQQPDMASLANRARNNWKPLFKIAVAAGGDWTNRAFAAANVPPPRQKDSDQVRLLKSIRNIFQTRNVDKIPTLVLLADLVIDQENIWYRYHNKREPLDANDLADLLIDFDIGPKPLSLTNEQQALFKTEHRRVVKGYSKSQFEPLFERFLVNEEAETVEVSQAGAKSRFG